MEMEFFTGNWKRKTRCISGSLNNMVVWRKHMHTLKWKWIIFLYALTIVITIKLLNTKGKKITTHQVPLLAGRSIPGDISSKFLRNGTNSDFNHTVRYRRAQSNTKLLGKLHELDNIRSQNEHPHMNSLSLTPRQIDSQTRNETDVVKFLPFLKKIDNSEKQYSD